MKILFLSRYIYDESIPEFTVNKTGFGMMVKDIANSVSEENEVLVLTRVITTGKLIGNNYILSHRWSDILKCFSVKLFLKGIIKAFGSRESLKNKFKVIYFNLDSGYTKKIIKEFKPDIIHIHGIDESSKLYIDVCDELNIPYIVTLHGLIGLNESVTASDYNKLLEKSFLQESERRNIPITVISTGIKKRIVKYYGLKHGDNICIIENGTKISYEPTCNLNIREKYNISQERKIIICIGNISELKNQAQIVEAYNKANESFKNKTALLFLGNDRLNGRLQKRVKELALSNNIFFCGFVDRDNIQKYIKQSDLNVVASMDEGFGLSMIECFVHGVPTVTFSDLDAIEDIYNENAMILVEERETQALTNSIEEAMNKDWDREWIKDYSKQFSLNSMSKKYEKLYYSILESWNNIEKN